MNLASLTLVLLMASSACGDPIDLKGKVAEDFDWGANFASGTGSTADQMTQAQAAVEVLKVRMDALCKQYRELMTKRCLRKSVT